MAPRGSSAGGRHAVGASASAILLIAVGLQAALVAAEETENITGTIHIQAVPGPLKKWIKSEVVHERAAASVAQIANVNVGCMDVFVTYVSQPFGEGVKTTEATVMFEINSTTAGKAKSLIESTISGTSTSSATATFSSQMGLEYGCANIAEPKDPCVLATDCECLTVASITLTTASSDLTSSAATSAPTCLFTLLALGVVGLMARRQA
mmetsp:Transcript_77092/g.200482  ORF Transcript_77092/g.200482 Transcript_77092/m.200482 type:complete len:209 (-) Transcript_77092:87-713(-)